MRQTALGRPSRTLGRQTSFVKLPRFRTQWEFTLAGPEMGVASTKAFTTQLATLACLAVAAARARGRLTAEREAALTQALER